jgi:hypothetical protein
MNLLREAKPILKQYLLMTLSFSVPLLIVTCLVTLGAGGSSHHAPALFLTTLSTLVIFLITMVRELFLFSRNLQRMS